MYDLSGADEWYNITSGKFLDRALNSSTGDISEVYYLPDPSDDLSFEEVARPSKRASMRESDELKGLGCGNVARVSSSKYVGTLGAKLKYTRKAYFADRVCLYYIYKAWLLIRV